MSNIYIYIYIQLTLEQHRFELHKSTYMQIFFNKYVLQYLLHDLNLAESKDGELRIWTADYKVIQGFSTA